MGVGCLGRPTESRMRFIKLMVDERGKGGAFSRHCRWWAANDDDDDLIDARGRLRLGEVDGGRGVQRM